jgi:hypothetical protein
MTRLFDGYGSFKCDICHKHPSIGWLYRCTQDFGGFLPESDFNGGLPNSREPPGQDVTTHSLSPSVIKAIGEGHYTDDQVKKLVQLKEEVRNIVLSHQPQDTRPPTSSTFSTSSSSSSDGDGTFSTIPQSTTFSTTSSTSLDEEIKQAYDWRELQKIWMSEPSTAPPQPRIPAIPSSLPPADRVPQLLPALLTTQPCNFMTCHTCRPTYRDRAYPSMEEMLREPTQLPPVWELQNRRVSDAYIVAKIGFPKIDPNRFYAQKNLAALRSSRTLPGIVIDDTDGELDCYDATTGGYVPYVAPGKIHVSNIRCETAAPCDYADYMEKAESPNKRSSLRQTLRNMLSRTRTEDNTSTDSSASTSGSEPLSRPRTRPRASSPLLFQRRRSRSSTLSFVETPGARIVDTSPLQESVMLMVATNTPLPETPGTNRFEAGFGMSNSGDY